jgi:hypothetical protein
MNKRESINLTKWVSGTVVVGLFPYLIVVFYNLAIHGRATSPETLLIGGSLFILTSAIAGASLAEILASLRNEEVLDLNAKYVVGRIGVGLGLVLIFAGACVAFVPLVANPNDPTVSHLGIAVSSTVLFIVCLMASASCIVLSKKWGADA